MKLSNIFSEKCPILFYPKQAPAYMTANKAYCAEHETYAAADDEGAHSPSSFVRTRKNIIE